MLWKITASSGGTYFITTKSVIEKVHIQHAKLVLELNIDVEGNDCLLCLEDLDDREIDIIYNLADLEDSINIEILYSIVYIAGYVQKCDIEEIRDDTTTYYEKNGTYLNTLNKGGLTIPSSTLSQWPLFCHIFFSLLVKRVCRTFLIRQFTFFALHHTPKSNKETKLKEIKLI